MDLDPDLAWPFWKFGLKKDDLFTKLHDQYNTFPSSIQDPEAFHHDVYECSQEAGTTDEFHRLLATRKEQRLRELNTSLESASLEIIANPSLIGTHRWQFALQLFRTKSLDSLVRYFSSYLPDNHPWREGHPDAVSDPSSGSNDDVKSKIHIPPPDEPSFFDDDDDVEVTHEPFSMMTSLQSHLPPSPRSMTMCSDSSVDNNNNTAAHHRHHTYVLHNLTPARTASFSESESERFNPDHLHLRHLHDDDSSQPESPISEYSEPFSEPAAFDTSEKKDVLAKALVIDDDPCTTSSAPPPSSSSSSSQPSATDDSERDATETPTPKPLPQPQPQHHAGTPSFFDTRPLLSPAVRARGCSFSPSRLAHPLAQVHGLSTTTTTTGDEHARPAGSAVVVAVAASARLRRRDHSPAGGGPGRMRRGRGSPGQQAGPARVQKSLPDHVGSRHRGRRRVEEC